MDRIKHMHWIGAGVTAVLGTLLHFAYEYSAENPIVALVAAVNESTWEHLKLLTTPYLLFGLIEYFVYGHRMQGMIAAKVYGLFAGMGSLIAGFYLYSGILGFHIGALNILLFYLAVAISYLLSYRWITQNKFQAENQDKYAGLLLILLLLCFWVFTSAPPKIGLFRDPTNGHFGI